MLICVKQNKKLLKEGFRMLKNNLRAAWMQFSDIFSTRDDNAKGRLIYLCCVILNAFYNVFITGIFYTGFLTMYGISITGAGIVTFIPFIANLFGIFSSKVLAKFKRRKPAMVASKVYFYTMYIIATNLMPRFVTDPDARLVWFVVILFFAYALYAPFTPGFTMWFYRFYPKDNERRTRYVQYQQIFASITSSLILLLSSIITDAVAGSAHQEALIIGLRYFAFVLVIIEIIIQAQAKEYPEPDESSLKLRDVFILPFRYKKFLKCMIMMFCWNYIANLNNGLWAYHLLNHMHFSYTLINAMSIAYTVILVLASGIWRKVLRHNSWMRTFGIALLWWVPTEISFFFMMPETAFLYVPTCLIQNFLSVGLNLSYANILYMNLPEENSTALIAFNSIGSNVCAFLGLVTGTWVSSLTGDNTVRMLGMELYSVQFTTLMRAVTILAMGLILVLRWQSFTREDDIEDVLRNMKLRKLSKQRKRGQYRQALVRLLHKR